MNLLSLGVKTGARIYQNKQRTKQLMSDAQMHHAEQMAKGEIEYKAKIIESNDNGWKEMQSRIAEAHPASEFAKQHGKRSTKEIKTQAVVEKHRKRQAAQKRK